MCILTNILFSSFVVNHDLRFRKREREREKTKGIETPQELL